jgi:YD repeat-containing protein
MGIRIKKMHESKQHYFGFKIIHMAAVILLLSIVIHSPSAQALNSVSATQEYTGCGTGNAAEITSCIYGVWINAYKMTGCAISQLTSAASATQLIVYVPNNSVCGYAQVPMVFPAVWICTSGTPDTANPPNCIRSSTIQDTVKNNGCDGSFAAAGTNPCNAGTGNKYEHEVDYVGTGSYPLKLERTYNSGSSTPSSVEMTVWGNQWRSAYDKTIIVNNNGVVTTATVKRASGKRYYFNLANGTWVGDSDVVGTLVQLTVPTVPPTVTGWRYTNENNEIETYDVSGNMISITNIAGVSQILSYSCMAVSATCPVATPSTIAPTAGLLIRVSDSAGHQLNFIYDGYGRVVKMTDPAGGVYTYTYSGITYTANLISVDYPDGKIRTYLYGEAANVSSTPAAGITYTHALTGILDENGTRYASWTYDSQGRAASSEHGAFGSSIDHVGLVYGTPDANGNSTTSVTDPRGNVRNYAFGTILGMLKNTGITGQPCNGCNALLTYDANGNVASSSDFKGNTTCYAYDQTSNLETDRLEGLAPGVACPTTLSAYTPTVGTAQRLISTQWNTTYRKPTIVAEPSLITNYVYNGEVVGVTTNVCGYQANAVTPVPGVVCSKTVQATTDTTGALGVSAAVTGLPRTWAYTYNSSGQVLTADGPRTDVNDITTYTYDTQNNLDTVTNALSQVTTLGSYDANGRPGTITDPNGFITDLVYDARGRLKSRTTGGEITSYTYDGVGQLTDVSTPSGASYTYTYDQAHRLTEIADNLGNHINYTLDVMGNRTLEQTFDSAGNLSRTHSRVFDALNHLYQDIGAVNQIATFTYDANGNLTNITDPLNRKTVHGFDALNRIVTSTDAAVGITLYSYDNLNQLVKVTDPKVLSTQYQRDGLGNLTQQTSPDTGVTTSTYDAAGNVLTRTDAKGQVTTYTYDVLNRLTKITYQPSVSGSIQQTATYQYDQGTYGIGHLTQITDNTGITDYGYDQHGRLITEARQVQGMTYTTIYSYDTSGRLVSIGYPSGRLVSYAFDAMGRTNQISTTLNAISQILASSVAYEPFGSVHSFNYGDGVTAPVQTYIRQRDQDGRIASYALHGKAMAIVYDAASQIKSITDPQNLLNPASYGYDALSRLNSFLYGSTSQAYYYDADGNRTSQMLGNTTTYSFGAGSNRLSGIQVSTAVSRPVNQDANGSTIADMSRQYSYDLRGRLVQVATAQGVVTYEVNALGLRVHKIDPYANTDILYHYDSQGHLIGESAVGSATFTREYIYLGDQPVAVMK